MSNRLLGIIAIICAPALLIEGLLLLGGAESNVITGVASMVFMVGWICSNTAMRRIEAAGTWRWGRAVLLVQLVGITLAFIFGFIEATALLDENNIVFLITDAAWPLSMVWMLVVGITVIVAKQILGWWRFVPVLCPFWLPISILVSLPFGDIAGLIIGFGLTAFFWVLLGYVVMSSDSLRRTSRTPGYARAR